MAESRETVPVHLNFFEATQSRYASQTRAFVRDSTMDRMILLSSLNRILPCFFYEECMHAKVSTIVARSMRRFGWASLDSISRSFNALARTFSIVPDSLTCWRG